MTQNTSETAALLDRTAVNDLIQRERMARDNGLWAEMASYYHPDSFMDVAWFQGTGVQFVEQTAQTAEKMQAKRPDAINFHGMGNAVVNVKNDRAIAETACTLTNFYEFEGVDVSGQGFVRLLWRAQRMNGNWLIAGLRPFYIRDLLLSCQPGKIPALDEVKLSQFRRSYKYLAYSLMYAGLSPRDDLPGIDRPETVAALRAGEEKWLQEG